jgi:predicted RNase H-like HicB family nuclease
LQAATPTREDQAFIASAPDLPGMRTHGTTRAEALAMGEEAIAVWLGAMRRAGRSLPAAKFTAMPYPVRPEANPYEIAGARRSA